MMRRRKRDGGPAGGAAALAAAWATALALAAAGGFAPAAAHEVAPALPNFAALARRYGPAVVNIGVTREVAQVGIQLPPGIEPGHPLAPFLARRVIGNREEVSLGSGFIVSADGYILTNRHVVGDADAVTVKLTDKREFKAKVVGGDALSDVALLKIDADHLPVVVAGSAGSTEVGDWVMAIGSPYGFANSVTSGIVSAKARSLPGESGIPFLQTDVPINPGSSGGPLFDLDGRVIAINSAIYSRTGGYQGLSFAIPIDVAMDVKAQLLGTGKVSRGQLGVTVQEVTQALARSFGLAKPDGALISAVRAGGPAAAAGLQAGDVVLAVDGASVRDAADLLATVARIRPGREVDLQVWRGGAASQVKAVVGALESPAGSAPGAPTPQWLGMTLRPLTPREQQRVGVDHGLLIQQVSGRAARDGIAPGDIVLSLNARPVATLEQFAEQLRQAGGNAALLIQRGRTRLYLPLDLG